MKDWMDGTHAIQKSKGKGVCARLGNNLVQTNILVGEFLEQMCGM